MYKFFKISKNWLGRGKPVFPLGKSIIADAVGSWIFPLESLAQGIFRLSDFLDAEIPY